MGMERVGKACEIFGERVLVEVGIVLRNSM